MSFEQIFPRGPAEDDSDEQEDVTPAPWFGPPDGELGASVPLSLVVGSSETGVVAVEHAIVYSTGVTFDVLIAGRGLRDATTQRLMRSQHMLHVIDDEEDPPAELVRIGFELADGSRGLEH